MGNGWSNQYQTSLTLPTGATSGARIVLDGTTDAELVYNAAGALIASIAGAAGTDGLGNAYPAGISASQGVTSQSTFLLYNGTPAAGNLIASIAAAAGTDAYGNAYFGGLNFGNQQAAHFGVDKNGVVYIVNSSAVTVVELRPSNGGMFVYDSSGVATNHLSVSIASAAGTDGASNQFPAGVAALNWSAAQFVQLLNGALNVGGIVSGAADTTNAASFSYIVNAGHPYLQVASPLYPSGSYTDNAELLLFPGVPSGGLGGSSRPIVVAIDELASSACDVNLSGAMIKTSLNGASVYTWQTPSLGSGWALGAHSGSYQNLQFRLDAEDNLVIAGVVNSTTTTPSATVFTLPAGYRPKTGQRPGVIQNNGGTYSAHSLEIATTGACTVDPAFTVSASDLYIYVTVPMGNIQ